MEACLPVFLAIGNNVTLQQPTTMERQTLERLLYLFAAITFFDVSAKDFFITENAQGQNAVP